MFFNEHATKALPYKAAYGRKELISRRAQWLRNEAFSRASCRSSLLRQQQFYWPLSILFTKASVARNATASLSRQPTD
jgi:hypothetical protein